jgi:ABC-type branched-chain amino acid transport systems, ATPase component
MDAPLLQLTGVNKSFGGVQAVKEVDFSIQKGELAALIGPNGAGKTTLFNLITGVYGVCSGDIRLGGQSILNFRTDQIVHKGVARTFQNLRLFQASSALENVMTATQQHNRYGLFEALTHLGRWKQGEKNIKKG